MTAPTRGNAVGQGIAHLRELVGTHRLQIAEATETIEGAAVVVEATPDTTEEAADLSRMTIAFLEDPWNHVRSLTVRGPRAPRPLLPAAPVTHRLSSFRLTVWDEPVVSSEPPRRGRGRGWRSQALDAWRAERARRKALVRAWERRR